MKLISSNYEIIEPITYSLDNLYKFVELCGRVCYKSEDKITSDSATKFVDRLIKSGHTSVLEHGTVYLKIRLDSDCTQEFKNWYNYIFNTFDYSPYSIVSKLLSVNGYEVMYITTNLRVLCENALLDELKPYFCTQPEDMHERRYTVRFICDRGVSHEFVRHRVFSFSQESTRYCNYEKDKFGNEITYVIPSWLTIPEGNYAYWDGDWVNTKNMTINIPDKGPESFFLSTLSTCELMYRGLINSGWKAQQARQVLPNALKTELIMTGFTHQWEGFFELRDDKKAHPDAYKLAHDLHNEFIKRNYVASIEDLLEYSQPTIIN